MKNLLNRKRLDKTFIEDGLKYIKEDNYYYKVTLLRPLSMNKQLKYKNECI